MLAPIASTLMIAASGSSAPLPSSIIEMVWSKCVKAEAGVYAETKEPAETVASVAESKCEHWADALRNSWMTVASGQKKPSSSAVDEGLANIRAQNRAKALEVVLDWRLRFEK